MFRTASLFLILISLIFTLSSCGPVVRVEPKDQENERKSRAGSIFGDGVTLGGDKQNSNSGVSGIAVNAFLWRASLDTISFMPLNQVDPFGGVIITDWYSPPKRTNERFKLNVYILSQELRSDGLRVSAFKETRDANGQWQTANLTKDFSLQMEDSILTRARQMRVNALENNSQ